MNDRELAKLIEHYKQRFGPRMAADRKFMKQSTSLAQALDRAANARGSDGRMQSHQWRIGAVTLRRWHIRLKKHLKATRACRSFDELHDLLWSLRLPRVGQLAVYDASVRLGHYLNLKPRAVYLHAGTRVGARNLGLPASGKTLAMRDLPAPLRRLSADHVENFLCIYKMAILKRTASAAVSCFPADRRDSICPTSQGCKPYRCKPVGS